MTLTKLSTIATLPFFHELMPQSHIALQKIARTYTLKTNENLFVQGDNARSIYIVLSGGVRLVEHTAEGKAITLKIYGYNDLFGMLAISGEFRQHASAIAVQDSMVIGFEGQAMREAILQHPDIGLTLVDALVDHVHHAHDRIRQMAVEKTERRLARALLIFCDKFGQLQDDNLSANFTQQNIAEFTGTTIETVNRTFRTWEKLNYIKRYRGRVAIHQREGLQRIADEVVDEGREYLVE